MSVVFEPGICRTILEGLPNGIYVVDLNRRILFWNDGAEKITGYLRQEVIGRFCNNELLMHCNGNNVVFCGDGCPLAGTILDGKARDVNVFLRHKDGQRVPVRVRAIPLRDENGSIVGAVESFDERILLPDAEVQPHNRAVHDRMDELAGIPDRESTQSHLQASLEDFAECHIPFAVLHIAIDRLDQFRHSHGQKAVEAIVRVAARTLARNLHTTDVAGRWAEDRFLTIAANCPPPALLRVAEMLHRILSLMAIPWWGDRVSVTVSIGATTVRADDTAESLLLRADEALAASLAEGGNRVTIR